MLGIRRASFWQLVHPCENTPEAAAIFHQRVELMPPHSIRYQQIAAALTILCASGSGAERARISFDIGYGSILEYTWRFIRLLLHLARRYIFGRPRGNAGSCRRPDLTD